MNALLPLWATAVALLLLALAGLLWPLLREPARLSGDASRPAATEREHLRQLYRLQREELEREQERQLLADEDRIQALDELDRRLLDELDKWPQSAITAELASDGRWRRRLPAAIISVLLPLGALSLYLQVGDPLAAATLASAPASSHLARGGDAEAMVVRLEERLRLHPDNLEGWLVLARSREMMEQYEAATRAYRRAVELAGQQQTPATFQARLHADMADAMASARSGALDAPVQAVLKTALLLDPDQPKALALAGSAELRQGRLDEARRHWQRLLSLLEPDSDMALRVRSDLGGLEDGGPAKSAAAEGTGHPRAPSTAKTGLSGVVHIDPAVSASVRPGDTVFVIVRAPAQGRMPVGLLRLSGTQFPLEFELDDRHAMSPDAPLSRFAELSIEVRISRTGSAQRQAGDPISRPQAVQVGSRGLSLRVDGVEPPSRPAAAALPGRAQESRN